MNRWFCSLACCLVLAATARADVAVYDSCTDAAGRTVAAEMDFALGKVVQATSERGQPAIRYNPQVLPRLQPKTRLFLFARECARLSLALPLDRAETPVQARRADCLGLATLVGASLVQAPDGVRELQADLVFSGDEWKLLPGPERDFALATCSLRSSIKLPPPGEPTARQANWNSCVRACADRLRQCQAGRRDAGCLATYERCEATCKGE